MWKDERLKELDECDKCFIFDKKMGGSSFHKVFIFFHCSHTHTHFIASHWIRSRIAAPKDKTDNLEKKPGNIYFIECHDYDKLMTEKERKLKGRLKEHGRVSFGGGT